MEQFKAFLTQKYGLEAAQSVTIHPPVTPAVLREAEAQAAKFNATAAPSGRPAEASSARSSAASSFRGHAVQTKKKIGENAQGDLWGLLGKYERLHFQRENDFLAKEAEDRKSEYREILEKQLAELNARRHSEMLDKISDHQRMQSEQRNEAERRAAEKAEKNRVKEELMKFMASETRRKAEKMQKQKLREKLERQRILEIMEAECTPGSEVMVPRLNRKKEDRRPPWEKDDAPKELDINAFCAGLEAQMREKTQERQREEDVKAIEKQVLDQDTEKAREEEKEAIKVRRTLRKQMDSALIKQMEETFPLTRDQKMNRDGKNKDVFINQPLVRLMADEPNFLSDELKQKLLLNPKH
jgi:hypothetical protein